MFKIMIADDHAMMREGLKNLVNDSGDISVIAEAGNGEETLERLQAGAYDLLLMDMSMPGMSGLDLIRRVRLCQPNLPILVMSMHDTGTIASVALKAGANGYITKNTDPRDFLSILRKIAQGGRYVDPTIANSLIFDRDDQRNPHEVLSDREKQIFCMITSGKSIKGIASDLILSPKTVSTYKRRIMEKMQLVNNVDLMRCSLKHQTMIA